jgi:hypothetical protein
MTELEWLKKESGLTDEEWKAYEALGTTGKLLAAVKKTLGLSEQAIADKTAAENERLALEARYQNEFVPEMQKVTKDALSATARAAAAEAQLKQAREYGVVPEPVAPVVDPNAPPVRAPGSPDPNAVTRDDFGRFSQSQSHVIITLNDLNAEHFKLFKEPLGDTQSLVDEVQRQRTLGHKDFTLKQAWEAKFNVPAKRQEILAAERKVETDAAVQAALREDRQKRGANPNMVTGQPSRFSTYNPADANAGKEPWKVPAGQRKAANQPWREKATQKIAVAA